MRVVSMFDGLAGARQALKDLNANVEAYHAYEIDKYCIQVAMNNHPDIIQEGSVVDADFSKHKNIDLLVGGFCCQSFSFSGKMLGFEDERGKLFFECVRALKEIKPKYFLFENVKMKKEYQDVISELLGVQPILIDSSRLTAQRRLRNYWTNIPNVSIPEDKGILLADILEDGVVDRDKSFCIDANYFKGGNLTSYFGKHRRQLVFSSSGRGNGRVETRISETDKSCTLTAMGNCASKRSMTIIQENNCFRKLTPTECEALQGYSRGYTSGISSSQRYKALGNSFTVPVIAHILKGIV